MSYLETIISTFADAMSEAGVSEKLIQATVDILRGDSSSDPGEDRAPKQRFLSSNNSVAKTERGDRDNAGTIKNEELKVDFSGKKETIICLNYSPKCHALFGDFGPKGVHSSFREDFLKGETWMSFNLKLAFGPGWIVTVKDKLPQLVKALKKAKIPFKKIDREEWEEEIREGDESSEEESGGGEEESESEEVEASESEEEESSEVENLKKKLVKVKKNKKVPSPEPSSEEEEEEPPKSQKKDAKPKKGQSISKNAWGNFEEPVHGIVFMNLPVGPKGQKKKVAVGWQNPDVEEDVKGVDSLFPLDEDYVAICVEEKWRYFTSDMLPKIKKVNKKLASQLEEMLERDWEEDEDGEEEELEEIDDSEES